MGRALTLLLVAGCRLGFDPVDDFATRPCTTEVVLLANGTVDTTLCAGTYDLPFAAVAGSRMTVALEPAVGALRKASLGLRSPDTYWLAGPTWRAQTIESSALVTIDGDQRVLLEIDVDLDVKLTTTIALPLGTVRHIAPNGADTAAGTAAAPWQTWPFTFGALRPGDVLIVHDGVWDEGTCTSGTPCLANAEMPIAVCPDVAASGTQTAPVTIVAQHQRRARIQGRGVAGAAMGIRGCAFWIIDGLYIANAETVGSMEGDGLSFGDVPGLVARNLLVERPNGCANRHAISISGPLSVGVVLEDSEVYNFHRDAVILYDTPSTATVRRIYVHSRNTKEATACTPNEYYKLRGDAGVECFRFMASTHCAIDNLVAENVAFAISDDNSDENEVAGSIGIDTYFGISLATAPFLRAQPARVRDYACVNCNFGLLNNGMQVVATNATLVAARGRAEVAEARGTWTGDQGNPATSTVLRNVLAFDNAELGHGYAGTTLTWDVRYANAFASPVLYEPAEPIDDDAGNIQRSLSIEPTLIGDRDGSCLVYVPAQSNMATAGENGGPLGANIIYQLENGVPTDKKLWNQRTGAFPCGAIVAGVNDVPGQSCFDVHVRARVGVAGCAIP